MRSPRRWHSPTSAWPWASAASTSSIVATQAGAEVSAATGPVATRKANGSDDEEDGLIVALAGGCRSATCRPPSAGRAALRLVRRRAPAPGRRRCPGRRRSRPRVTTRSSRPRANTDTTRCGACGVPSRVGHTRPVGGCAPTTHPSAPVAQRANGPPHCHVSTTRVGHGCASPSNDHTGESSDRVGSSAATGVAQRRISEGEVEERPDGLRRRRQLAHAEPLERRRRRAAHDDVEAEAERPLLARSTSWS